MSNEELVAEIQAGATERMGELWEQVEKLIKWKANRIMTVLEGCPGRGVEFEDLYQSGYLAMVAAVNTYDSTAGGNFVTWLMYHLKNAFAEATGYRTQKGRQEPLNNYLSLDTPLTDDTDSDALMDVMADPKGLQWQESVEDSMWQKELQEAVGVALSTLPEQHRDILYLRYWENMTLEDIGDLRGVSKERVRQMENKGIRLLRQPRNACHLRPFYDFDFYCHTSLRAFNQTGMSVQERYLVIEEERREREAQERKRRDEEWNRRMEENRKWWAEQQEKRENRQRDPFIEEMMQSLSPEAREKLQQMLKEHGRT